MKKMLNFLLFFSLFILLFQYSLFSSEKTVTDTLFSLEEIKGLENTELEFFYQAQFNKDYYYGSFNIFNFYFVINESPLSIGGNYLKISAFRIKKKSHYALNSYSGLLFLPPLLSMVLIKDDTISSVTMIPFVLTCVANVLSNPEIQIKLLKNPHIRLFSGLNSDFYIIDNEFDYRVTANAGISLFKPWNFKVFLSKELHSIKKTNNEIFLGISVGAHGNFKEFNIAWF